MEWTELVVAVHTYRTRLRPQNKSKRAVQLLQEKQRAIPGSRLHLPVGFGAGAHRRRELRGEAGEDNCYWRAVSLLR